jgi:DNA-binding NarL/FixJ family response regulator
VVSKERHVNLSAKTILLIDDEQGYLEPLADALEFEGHRVIKAITAESALNVLKKEKVDLVTIDIMLPPGKGLEKETNSHSAGIYLCEEIRSRYPQLDAFCISVVSDVAIIRRIQKLGITFLRKGETPLRTVLNMLRSRLTGIAYSTERDGKGRKLPEH